MRAESTIMPVAPYEIEFDGEVANVTFIENVVQQETAEDEAPKWSYDEYRMTLRNRDSLITALENNLPAWVQMARDAEYAVLAQSIRQERDRLLSESDWTQVLDVPLTDGEKEGWRAYRQALRDVPQQEGFPYEVQWPIFS